jgi:hydrogenase maturation factor
VLRLEGLERVEVEDVNHVVSVASLLAYEDTDLSPGDWVSVLSGYVIDRVDALEASSVIDEIRRSRPTAVPGGVS